MSDLEYIDDGKSGPLDFKTCSVPPAKNVGELISQLMNLPKSMEFESPLYVTVNTYPDGGVSCDVAAFPEDPDAYFDEAIGEMRTTRDWPPDDPRALPVARLPTIVIISENHLKYVPHPYYLEMPAVNGKVTRGYFELDDIVQFIKESGEPTVAMVVGNLNDSYTTMPSQRLFDAYEKDGKLMLR